MDSETRAAEVAQAKSDTLAAENSTLRAELDALKQNQSKAAAVVEADEIKGMSTPKNMTVTVINHQDYKHEKIAPTRRQDMGFDDTQRFNGRQP